MVASPADGRGAVCRHLHEIGLGGPSAQQQLLTKGKTKESSGVSIWTALKPLAFPFGLVLGNVAMALTCYLIVVPAGLWEPPRCRGRSGAESPVSLRLRVALTAG